METFTRVSTLGGQLGWTAASTHHISVRRGSREWNVDCTTGEVYPEKWRDEAHHFD